MNGTHASFFSGVGGTDLGLERAGWRTVSFSEIDPYACAVLAERWPGVPNIGDIVQLAGGERSGAGHTGRANGAARNESDDWGIATLWSGGFPCQDLSVAGKRRGMVDGTRSNLAYAFLALVERHRPPAVLLENVPGLLSSHGGRDMAALTGRMVELGYGVAYRVLDAQHFGVPQRRRRVFIVGLRSGPDDADGRVAASRAAAVLSVGARCDRHPATGHETGPGTASLTGGGADSPQSERVWSASGSGPSLDTGRAVPNVTVGALPAGVYGFPDGVQEFMQGHFQVVGPPPDANGMRAPDGLAGRPHDQQDVARPLRANRWGGADSHGDEGNVVTQSLPTQRVGTDDNDAQGGFMVVQDGMADDPLLPLGLDSHRYRCCGNGVVAPVAEWIGAQLLAALRGSRMSTTPRASSEGAGTRARLGTSGGALAAALPRTAVTAE